MASLEIEAAIPMMFQLMEVGKVPKSTSYIEEADSIWHFECSMDEYKGIQDSPIFEISKTREAPLQISIANTNLSILRSLWKNSVSASPSDRKG
jgi:hypothetical protein